VLVRTTKEEKYGRILADCYREGAPSLCRRQRRLRLDPLDAGHRAVR
jgi:hypothetical protein